jgi:hypothetical protein
MAANVREPVRIWKKMVVNNRMTDELHGFMSKDIAITKMATDDMNMCVTILTCIIWLRKTIAD